VGLSLGLLDATVTLLSFVGILWSLSGGFSFEMAGETYNIPGFMVWMALAYALTGSLIGHLIGRSMASLNFAQQRLEADFRHHLMRVREYSEAIALDRGGSVERLSLQERFKQVLDNFMRLLRVQKRYTWFNSGYGQAAVVFPMLVASPRYFSGAIQLGELMQISSAFGQVQESLSWFISLVASHHAAFDLVPRSDECGSSERNNGRHNHFATVVHRCKPPRPHWHQRFAHHTPHHFVAQRRGVVGRHFAERGGRRHGAHSRSIGLRQVHPVARARRHLAARHIAHA
jgi:hypothetical protein